MAPSGTPIRVLCVEDHRIVRDGLVVIISLQPDMEVVGTAATGEEAVAMFRALRPDLTLMDLQLPGIGGFETIARIRDADASARIIVLTMHGGNEDTHRALHAGAAAYLPKDTVADDLIRIMRDVHLGDRPMPPSVRARLDRYADHAPLTAREAEVLQLVSQGRRNKEVGAALDISEATVHVHLKHIFGKLGVTDRTAAVHVALKRGIIHLA